MQSDPRKIHMPTFRWSSPVFPRLGSWWTACAAMACSAKARLLVAVPGSGPVMLDRELVHEHQGQEAADDDLIHADQESGDHACDREREQDRPIRWGRH